MRPLSPVQAFQSLVLESQHFSERESNGRYPGPGGLIKRKSEDDPVRVALRQLTSDMVKAEPNYMTAPWPEMRKPRGRFNIDLSKILCPVPRCRNIMPPKEFHWYMKDCGCHKGRS